MGESLLFVDDETRVLELMQEIFQDHPGRVFTAISGREGGEMLRQEEIAVVVTDYLMPGMSGVEFLQEAKNASPKTVRILMTGYANVRLAVDAINKGEVYKLLLKPLDASEFVKTVAEALNRYRSLLLLQREDEATLLSLAQTIELKDPYTKGHCDRVGRFSLMIAQEMGIPEQTCKFIQYGGWLHDCGKIGIPESILNSPRPLTLEEMKIVENHCIWGANVARLAKLPETVYNIIMYHHEKYDGTGYPARLQGDLIPLEARIIAVADGYDAMSSDRSYRNSMSAQRTWDILEREKGVRYDPHIVDLFLKILPEVDKLQSLAMSEHEQGRFKKWERGSAPGLPRLSR